MRELFGGGVPCYPEHCYSLSLRSHDVKKMEVNLAHSAHSPVLASPVISQAVVNATGSLGIS